MFVHLDPRRQNVMVPKGFMGQPQLVLQVGLNMAIPIPDLEVDDVGISCTLSFSRTPFWCRIPWSAVYALVGEDGRGGVWAEDVPPEIQLQKQQQAAPKQPAAKKPKAKLAAVETATTPSEPELLSTKRNKRDEAKGEPKEKRGLSAVPGRQKGTGPAAAPALAAVPEPAAAEETSGGEDRTDKPAPAAPAAGHGAGKKPKREIPSYLRVIK